VGDPDVPGDPEVLTLSHCSVATSGDAEQHLIVEGVRRSHILDPRGGPAVADRPELPVVAPPGAEAAWSP
ncbi:MAG: FAD:protein FMN transferase, partial [Candidatus Nanopelagicales bacterium]